MARKKKIKLRSNADRRKNERRAILPEKYINYNPNNISFWEKIQNAFMMFGRTSKLIK